MIELDKQRVKSIEKLFNSINGKKYNTKVTYEKVNDQEYKSLVFRCSRYCAKAVADILVDKQEVVDNIYNIFGAIDTKITANLIDQLVDRIKELEGEK